MSGTLYVNGAAVAIVTGMDLPPIETGGPTPNGGSNGIAGSFNVSGDLTVYFQDTAIWRRWVRRIRRLQRFKK